MDPAQPPFDAGRALVFSDVHLQAGAQDRARVVAFAAWLRRWAKEDVQTIVCLGDLFDFWFEYRHVVFSAYFQVLRAIADVRDAGIAFHLVCGNHDFWAGRFLEQELGMHVHRDGAAATFGPQRVWLIHGDGINPSDWSYRGYKRVARSWWAVSLFRALHPDWAMALAQGVSHGSRTLLQATDPADGPEARALRAYAQTTLESGAYDVVMCGHAHAPEQTPMDLAGRQGLYINTGTWMDAQTHVLWDGDRFQLKSG